MTLKEKFRDKILSFLSDNMKEQNAIECEQIADDYAIEFAKWYEFMLRQTDNLKERFTENEILEMFKKEKGL
jgi:hypothetical protein